MKVILSKKCFLLVYNIIVLNKKLKNIVLKVYFIHCRYLLPEKAKGGKQKTGVCRKTVCPKWEHTMAWDDISLEALWDRSLELTVWDHDRLGHNEILGGVRFNLGKDMSKLYFFFITKYFLICFE